MRLRHALSLAPFGELASPDTMVEVARAADAAGWDGFYLWDHVHRDPTEVAEISDVWIMLAAVAAATETIRIGPMVTPLSRRRIATLIRQTVTLDHLSHGRLTMGIGLGVDTAGELTRFGEETDARTRADILDESADLLVQAWSGELVAHEGPHRTIDDVAFRPTPVQQPTIPIWCAARGDALRPVRRSARFDGLFLIEVNPDQLERAIAEVAKVRGSLDGFDVAVVAPPSGDSAQGALGQDAPGSGASGLLAVPGVTWAVHMHPPAVPAATALAAAIAGPPPSSNG